MSSKGFDLISKDPNHWQGKGLDLFHSEPVTAPSKDTHDSHMNAEEQGHTAQMRLPANHPAKGVPAQKLAGMTQPLPGSKGE